MTSDRFRLLESRRFAIAIYAAYAIVLALLGVLMLRAQSEQVYFREVLSTDDQWALMRLEIEYHRAIGVFWKAELGQEVPIVEAKTAVDILYSRNDTLVSGQTARMYASLPAFQAMTARLAESIADADRILAAEPGPNLSVEAAKELSAAFTPLQPLAVDLTMSSLSRRVELLGVYRGAVESQIDAMRTAMVLIVIVGTLAVGLLVLTNRRLRARGDELLTISRELEKARDLAEDASATKTRFLANLSHELRTPLNAITGFSQIMRDEMFGPMSPRYRQYCDDIHASAEFLNDLMSSILDLSRVEIGAMELSEQDVDVAAVLRLAVRSMADEIGRRSQTVHVEATAPVVINADGVKLKQCVFNLLSNAVKYSHEGGAIDVATRIAPDGWAEIAVVDKGVGIPSGEQETIFKPFHRASNVRSSLRQGAGMGLPLVKAIVDEHGGEVRLSSLEGEGTSVLVRFPPSRVVAAPDSKPGGRRSPTRGVG